MANAICVMIGQVNAFGVVFFKMEVTECVLVKGEFTGLPPGKHGLHIHSFGDLTMVGSVLDLITIQTTKHLEHKKRTRDSPE
ncbi:superoxide dismutase [Cu-Zn]-like isoform X5 [Scyliorhinus canicula]|uniref:superoxide dismutase [Cu-Zn]-like isoform X5 n=1 Tax=Scyliorhinus canicula TaxID=7830 RepID=UPI0018F7CA77|nr:superoxide dismutase [Cu-Zn]-like isoform X5 [Scyliorhinus canicula]XP_038658234.1 superoxide dismutase [Cu-Zn]-like isoform X5 [Scyliorhinus canicula]